ncbi:MAG TPA: LacI family DNA-binding transcriptional regulator [Victivallales bacterium]|nr:LacI family DNA-binding transcriptional regulator [Victivallales bacterium]HPO89543.1 LacI family DNA-binding transcriptional regulator [Victivallales bacterium]
MLKKKQRLKKKISINDVATALGISRGTVSRAFNDNRKDINPETRQRILEAAKRMGYYPDMSARRLVKGKTECIGIIVPDLRNPFLCEMVTEIEKYTISKGYSALLSLVDNNIENQEKILTRMKSGQVDGIIITPCEHRKTVQMLNKVASQKPLVSLKKIFGLKCDIVSFDDSLGVQMMTEYLISKGHKKIVYLCPEEPELTVQVRFTAYKMSMENASLESKVVNLCTEDRDSDQYIEMIEGIFNSPYSPTAIFAYDDMIAINLIKTLKNMGVKVPDDISIVGFDNISFGEMIDPPLTTVAIDGAALGKNAVETIFSKIENQQGFESIHELKLIPKLIERASVSQAR